MTSYVLSVLGNDRAGLVEALAEVVAAHGGDWGRSHMAQLGGKFAGLVLVDVPEDRGVSFLNALEPLQAMGLLDITVEVPEPGAPGLFVGSPLTFEIVGNDRPGIVHEVSRLLASLQVNVVELITKREAAAMDGGMLFRAWAEVHLPSTLTADELVGELEALATDLMVDLAPGATRPTVR